MEYNVKHTEKDYLHQNDIEYIDKTPNGYFGGAWKVAYADFVTAMMAFFLLMWLLNATTEEQRSGIADYFDPKVPISQTSAGGMGMFNGDSVFAQQKLARNGLGGAGQKSAAGRDDKEKHEVSTTEDVWRKGTAESKKIGEKFQKDASTAEAEIKRQLEKIAGGNGLSKQLQFKMTDEGLRIDITDKDGVPMFDAASQNPTAKMQSIMNVVGSVLSGLENEITVTGHTDSVAFESKRNYSNWELSADRANAARRLLTQTGINDKRIKRVEGRADKEPFDAKDPKSAINRRIGVILLRDTSQDNMVVTPEPTSTFEQEKVLKNNNRAIGSSGGVGQDLYIPDKKAF